MTAAPQSRIVVGVSTSLSGLAALRLAVTEAHHRGLSTVTAVRTWPDASRGRSAPWAPDLIRACKETIDRAVAATFAGVTPGVTIERIAPRGHPGPALVDLVANDQDMIFVGTRRRYRPGTGVGGYCARHAPCPVVVVPPPSMIGRGGTRHLARSLLRELDNASTFPWVVR